MSLKIFLRTQQIPPYNRQVKERFEPPTVVDCVFVFVPTNFPTLLYRMLRVYFPLFGERVKYKSFFLGKYDDEAWREEKN